MKKLDNNRIILPFCVQLTANETGVRIKIPLKGKGTLETLTLFSDSDALINVIRAYQKKETKGIIILAEEPFTDNLTGTVYNKLTFGTAPIILMLNINFQDTFLELWFDNNVGAGNDIGLILRIMKKEPQVRRQN